jgi:DNA-binding Lrp family transcriptional regulator
MKSSPAELAIFAALRFKADSAPASHFALTGQRHEAVHRAITKGLDERVILFTSVINTYLIGLHRYSIFFSLSSEGRSKRAKVQELIQGSEIISWGAELGGDYDLGITLLAKSPADAYSRLENFNRLVGDVFQERAINAQLRMFLYPLKFLAPNAKHEEPVEIGPQDAEVPLSLFQLSLLRWLANNGQPSIKDMSRAIGASAQEIEEGIGYLKKTKVLACVGLIPHAEKLGLQIFLLLVHTKNSHPGLKESVRAFCEKHQRIDRLIECLGTWEFEIGLCVEHEGEAATIAEELTQTLGQERISHIKIIPLYQELMVTWLPASAIPDDSSHLKRRITGNLR